MDYLTIAKAWFESWIYGLNLGYDFYKSDWKYLNDATTGALTLL